MQTQLNRRNALTFAAAIGCAGLGPATAKEGPAMDMLSDRTTAYFDAWARKDLKALAALIHPDIVFKSPTAVTNGHEAYLAAAARVFPLLEGFTVRAQFASASQAMAAYDFICRQPIGVSATAELLTFDAGLVRQSEVFFDARPFVAFAQAMAQQQKQ